MLLIILFCLAFGLTTQSAAHPRRIVSINACTDQLLFKIADPGQIAALSVFAADPGYSIYAGEVRNSGIWLISGSVEEVLKLKPDLVLAGAWTRTATRAQLKSQGIPLQEFAPDESVEATFAAIEGIARLTGHEERGAALIREINEAFAEAPSFRDRPISAMQLQRRGFTSGRRTLLGELLERLGVANAADRLGITGTGATKLETVLKARPDVLIMLQLGIEPSDQGAAMLLHPALTALYPPERRIVLPNQLTACGGPALVEAVQALARELQQVQRLPNK